VSRHPKLVRRGWAIVFLAKVLKTKDLYSLLVGGLLAFWWGTAGGSRFTVAFRFPGMAELWPIFSGHQIQFSNLNALRHTIRG
jgi:hypothetical protein